jgi:hypothetical protein
MSRVDVFKIFLGDNDVDMTFITTTSEPSLLLLLGPPKHHTHTGTHTGG